MPKAYTQAQLTSVYQEIALERKHVCNNCNATWPLSHSHLVKKSRDGELAINKLNIVFHCLDTADKKGCHSTFESLEAATMKDFEDNFGIIYKLDREYFWLRVIKMFDHYSKANTSIAARIRNLYLSLEEKENAVPSA